MFLTSIPLSVRAQFPVFPPKNYLHAATGEEPQYLHGGEDRDALVKATTGMFWRGDHALARVELKKLEDKALHALVSRLRGEVNAFARGHNGQKPVLYAREVFPELRLH
jgi:hypothetical protein